MKKILAEIQSGEFAKQWIAENKSGRHKFLAMREAAQTDQIETVGKSLRDMMPFLKKKKEVGVPVAYSRRTARLAMSYENPYLRHHSPGWHARRVHLFLRGRQAHHCPEAG